MEEKMYFLNQLNPLVPPPSFKNERTKKAVKPLTEQEKAADDIKWINAFYKEHRREPIFDRNNMIEYALCEKLQRLRFNYEALPFLKGMDTYKLLSYMPNHSHCKSRPGVKVTNK